MSDVFASQPPPGYEVVRSRFLLSSLIIAGLTLAGFFPYLRGIATLDVAPVPALTHIHAIVFLGWLAVYLEQARRIRAGAIAAHRRLGRWALRYGYLVLLLGLLIGFYAPAHQYATGRLPIEGAAFFLIFPVGDMVLFTPFFIAAARSTHTPEKHKRYMLLAFNALLFPGVARLLNGESPLLLLAVFLLPGLLAWLLGRADPRREDRILVLGLVAMTIMGLRGGIAGTAVWQAIAQPVVRALAPFAG